MGAVAALLLIMAGPAPAGPEAALVGTYWRAVEIDGSAVAPSPNRGKHIWGLPRQATG